MRIILDTTQGAGYSIPGSLIVIAVARIVWSRTTVRRPDGGRWTRGERAAWVRAERRRNLAIAKQQRQAARRR